MSEPLRECPAAELVQHFREKAAAEHRTTKSSIVRANAYTEMAEYVEREYSPAMIAEADAERSMHRRLEPIVFTGRNYPINSALY